MTVRQRPDLLPDVLQVIPLKELARLVESFLPFAEEDYWFTYTTGAVPGVQGATLMEFTRDQWHRLPVGPWRHELDVYTSFRLNLVLRFPLALPPALVFRFRYTVAASVASAASQKFVQFDLGIFFCLQPNYSSPTRLLAMHHKLHELSSLPTGGFFEFNILPMTIVAEGAETQCHGPCGPYDPTSLSLTSLSVEIHRIRLTTQMTRSLSSEEYACFACTSNRFAC